MVPVQSRQGQGASLSAKVPASPLAATDVEPEHTRCRAAGDAGCQTKASRLRKALKACRLVKLAPAKRTADSSNISAAEHDGMQSVCNLHDAKPHVRVAR